MKIILSHHSSVPLYEQIKKAIKDNILKEKVVAGEKLPSVRNLSKDIGVSILTVKKAYDELEEEGFIASRQGLGTFVSTDDRGLKREEKQKILEDHLLKAIEMSKEIELSKDAFFDLVEYLYKGDQNE